MGHVEFLGHEDPDIDQQLVEVFPRRFLASHHRTFSAFCL